METSNTKFLRVESYTDKTLAWLIALRPPLTTTVVLLALAVAFALGLAL